MKKFTAILIALALMMSAAICENETADTLSVATLTQMRGYFFTDLWGNNSTDLDVQNLIHGLSTVAWMSENEYAADPTVVKELLTQDNADGSKTFYIFLNDGLTYSDGSEITAADYVFTVLLLASPQVKELGGTETAYNFLTGYEAYHSGETRYFAGVRLLGRTIFSLTVDSAYLPFYYENSYVDVTPYPIQVLLGDYMVTDSEDGAFLTTDDDDLPVPFESKNLSNRLFGKNGYMSTPAVVSGPYCIDKYDAVGGTVSFTANPYYPGNAYGAKPNIEKLLLTGCGAQEAMDGLKSGRFDLLCQCVSAEMIKEGTAAGFTCELYPRRGLGYVCFACEGSILSDVSVRKAIACATDREGFAESYLGSYGAAAYGYYGLGQWMVQAALGNLSVEGAEQVSVESFSTTPFDLETAFRYLDEAGWDKALTLDSREYVIRCNEKGELLKLKLAVPAGSKAAEEYIAFAKGVYEKIGIALEIDELPFDALSDDLYSAGEREYDMYFLGSNFSKVFDPTVIFNADERNTSVSDLTRVADNELFSRALAMRSVKAGDTAAYFDAWCAFQTRFNEVMPLLPLYSNLYADLGGSRLKAYSVVGRRDWTEAILYASLSGSDAQTETWVRE